MTTADEMPLTESGVVPTTPPKLRAMPRWLVPALLVQLLILVAFATGVRAIATELGALEARSAAHKEAVEKLQQQAAAMVSGNQALRMEVETLRHAFVTSSTEDVIFLKTTILKPDIDPARARLIAKNVHKYAEIYGRDPNLVLAMIAVESRFDPDVVSPVGAVGLMQIMPQWKKVLGIQGELSDPEISIKHGLQILGFYMEMYKDLETALTAYNRGPGPVDMALMRGQDPRNRYAPRVLEAYEKLKRLTVNTKA